MSEMFSDGTEYMGSGENRKQCLTASGSKKKLIGMSQNDLPELLGRLKDSLSARFDMDVNLPTETRNTLVHGALEEFAMEIRGIERNSYEGLVLS